MTKKRSKALDNKCPSCGAPIKFVPSLKKWKCEYCNSEFDLEEMQKHNNASNIKYNQDSIIDDYDDYVTYTCQDCGAEIVADSQTAATFCVYCGNTAILKNKLSGKFLPDAIIPFKKEKQEAIDAFVNLAKGKLFVPKNFTKKDNIEKIRGIYIPFWLYDIDIAGSIDCNGTKIRSWSTGNVQYTRTEFYKMYRTGSMDFFKIPVDGSKRFSNDIMNSIEPFDYSGLTKYNHAYLSGFYAEKYDVPSDEASVEARRRALESGKNAFLDDCRGYSQKNIVRNTLETKIKNKYYVLLPVWMVNVKYNNKSYIFAMNGQTGEFVGNIPLDILKVIVWTILIFGLVFGLVIAIAWVL